MFYIVEKVEQLGRMGEMGECFMNVIPFNNNFHPALQRLSISLIYIYSFSKKKSFIICVEHNESLSLSLDTVKEFLVNKTSKIFVLDKKETLYYFPFPEKLYDIQFIQNVDLKSIDNQCVKWYYNHSSNVKNLNCLIPVTKHFEHNEAICMVVQPIIKSFSSDVIFEFNNGALTQTFFEIETVGMVIDKNSFSNYFLPTLTYPEFNISNGRIYTQYNLYTITGRPSNSFNGINFAALNKTNGERCVIVPKNDKLIEFDYSGYHPRLIAKMLNLSLPDNIYEHLGIEKKEMFQLIYGGIRQEYKNKSYFREIVTFIENMWDTYQWGNYKTSLRTFNRGEVDEPQKLFNYVIQGLETYNNTLVLQEIFEYLKDKQTKLILYTYDAFLFDYSEADGEELLIKIKEMMKLPVSIKYGKTYHGLEKI